MHLGDEELRYIFNLQILELSDCVIIHSKDLTISFRIYEFR